MNQSIISHQSRFVPNPMSHAVEQQQMMAAQQMQNQTMMQNVMA